MAVIWLLMKYKQQEKFYLERDWEKRSSWLYSTAFHINFAGLQM